MEEILKEVLKSTPEAFAVLATVIIFLRAISRRDDILMKQQDRWFEAWKTVVDSNTDSLKAVHDSVGELKGSLENYNSQKS